MTFTITLAGVLWTVGGVVFAALLIFIGMCIAVSGTGWR